MASLRAITVLGISLTLLNNQEAFADTKTVVESSRRELSQAIKVIARTGPEGAGSTAAATASRFLSEQTVELLPTLLAAMDTDNVVAANWYRVAFDEIVRRESKKTQPEFPQDFLREFVTDAGRSGRSRRLALRLLDQIDPEFRTTAVPRLLDDPEFRSDAVAIALSAADEALAGDEKTKAAELFQTAFAHSRESGQISRAADGLAKLGKDANIVRKMGFVTEWYLLGPFDAPGTSGFNTEFPPEKSVDLDAEYVGQGESIRWNPHTASDRFGQLNLNQAIRPVKEAVGYAYTEFDCDSARAIEIRCGADDNLTVWLNGKKVFGRKEWLNGTRLDRFTARGKLRKGRNTLLVKVCQGPQHRNPAVPNNWSLQLRLCDATGAGIAFRSALPKNDR